MAIYSKTIAAVLLTGALCMGGCVSVVENYDGSFPGEESLITQRSAYSVDETIDRLENIVTSKGLTVFARVDHQENARKAGLEQRPSTVLIFGSPKIGSPIMNASPLAGIDLPVKALAFEDREGRVFLSYNNPDYLKARHNIIGADASLQKMSGALAKFSAAATQ